LYRAKREGWNGERQTDPKEEDGGKGEGLRRGVRWSMDGGRGLGKLDWRRKNNGLEGQGVILRG
jgi:hypothetical protein